MKTERILKHEILEFRPDTLAVVQEAYGLGAGRADEAVDLLQAWISKQEHFVKKDFPRAYLESTLIASKGSVEKAKQRLDTLCTMRTFAPQLFEKFDVIQDFKDLQNIATIFPLPKLTEDHYRIGLIKVTGKPTASYFLDSYRRAIIIGEYLKMHDYCSGNIFVADIRDVNILEFTSKWNLMDFRNIVTVITKGYGARIQGIHILSSSKLVDVFLGMLKSVLSAKLVSRMHAHRTLEELHQHVPRRVLPEDLGGEERSIDKLNDEGLQLCSKEDNVNFMRGMQDARTDESRRRAELTDPCFGIPGTFRALDVD